MPPPSLISTSSSPWEGEEGNEATPQCIAFQWPSPWITWHSFRAELSGQTAWPDLAANMTATLPPPLPPSVVVDLRGLRLTPPDPVERTAHPGATAAATTATAATTAPKRRRSKHRNTNCFKQNHDSRRAARRAARHKPNHDPRNKPKH
eukprot:6031699-Pyramimonas_sp.AAC.1